MKQESWVKGLPSAQCAIHLASYHSYNDNGMGGTAHTAV